MSVNHPVPDRVKPSFVIFDTLTLSPERQSARMSKIASDPVWHRMFYSSTPMATVGVKGLIRRAQLFRFSILTENNAKLTRRQSKSTYVTPVWLCCTGVSVDDDDVVR